ncbi:hypothetical protein H257_03342 [Aphanomyces astaci]|uniref:Uncharacterized protein n=1 Tax=Aphanomyces astaci TaxID=112090 RepID=W4GW61_APHAT|nr:hypothetical protein H257_03342 [Aphanomyces astaci]ETV83965.1 hypothetical protein H257_03342 [Aphanomyces astaci]|eukprot:XP_009825657.1 hypothetical protein H257_03342 [Aphanomyces astaci]
MKDSRRYFALHDTTSCIMYWGLANDLLAIEHDESGVDGLHLVRQSSKFAFANVSMESLLAQQSVLLLPLSVGRHIVRDTLDPFGPCPVAVRALHRTITATIMTVLNVNSEAHATFLSLPSLYDGLVPPHSYYSKAPGTLEVIRSVARALAMEEVRDALGVSLLWLPPGMVANPWEILRNISLHTYHLSRYITYVLAMVAVGVCVRCSVDWAAASVPPGTHRPVSTSLDLAQNFQGSIFAMRHRPPNTLTTSVSSNQVN